MRYLRYERQRASGQWDGAWTWKLTIGASWLEGDDSLGQHKLREASLMIMHAFLLPPHIFPLICIASGNVLTIKACQSANAFSGIRSPYTKQAPNLKVRDPTLIRTWAHLHMTPHEGQAYKASQASPSVFQSTLDRYDNFAINILLNSMHFKSNVFSCNLYFVCYVCYFTLNIC